MTRRDIEELMRVRDEAAAAFAPMMPGGWMADAIRDMQIATAALAADYRRIVASYHLEEISRAAV